MTAYTNHACNDRVLQAAFYEMNLEDVLMPSMSYKSGDYKINSGEQFLAGYGLTHTSAGGEVIKRRIEFLDEVRCYSTADTRWLAYRMKGHVYTAKKRNHLSLTLTLPYWLTACACAMAGVMCI